MPGRDSISPKSEDFTIPGTFSGISMKLVSLLCCILLTMQVGARPARNIRCTLRQPDGYSFAAIVKGDEFLRIKTTRDGFPIVQDKDGYWSFASYDSMGDIMSSGIHVSSSGKPAFKADIPYDKLMKKAAAERHALSIRTKSSFRSTGQNAGKKVKSIVILAQFSDIGFTYGKTDFEMLLNSKGYSIHGANGSVKDYFEAQFGGLCEFDFTVSEMVTLPKGRKYYGENTPSRKDKNIGEMVADACRLADEEIDYSEFDQDGDGMVDHLFIFYPGADESEGMEEECIWAQSWYLYEGSGISLVLDGTTINHFACSAEFSTLDFGETLDFTSIGPFCHEFCHTMGLPDMYDTDYGKSGGISPALWSSLSIMDNGCYNNLGRTPPCLNGIEREICGICEPLGELQAGNIKLQPIGSGGTAYRISSEKEGEYYVLECRDNSSWDSYTGGKGLLLYHIDRSDNDAGYSETFGKNLTAEERWSEVYNEINCRPDHECVRIVAAKPEAVSASELFFPQDGNSRIEPEGLTQIKFWDGTKPEVYILNIRRNSDGSVEMDVSFKPEELPQVQLDSIDIFQDAAIVSWSSSGGFDGEGCLELSTNGEKSRQWQVKAFAKNHFACVIDSLATDTPYKLEMYFSKNGKKGETKVTNFTTKAVPKTECYPFIMLKNVPRNEDGSFPDGVKLPLRVNNAVKAEKIVWTYDGKDASIGTNGYFCPQSSGSLKAEICFPDGSKDIIVRKIRIK